MAQVFKKTFPNNPVNLSTGKGLRFEDFGNNIGFFTTEDPAIIAELRECMKAGRGGIQASTMEEYHAALKKKLNSPALRASSFRENQTAGLVTIARPPTAPEAVVPVVAATEPEKPVVPVKPPEPKIGKRVAQA